MAGLKNNNKKMYENKVVIDEMTEKWTFLLLALLFVGYTKTAITKKKTVFNSLLINWLIINRYLLLRNNYSFL